MTRRAARAVVVIAALSAVPLVVTSAQQAGPRAEGVVADEVLVRYRPNVAAARRNAVAAAHAAAVARRFRTLDTDLLRLPPGRDRAAAIAALRAQPEVLLVQPNYIRQVVAPASPNDPWWSFGFLWGLQRIEAPIVWGEYTTGDSAIVVADIDTGVDYTHPDLAANMWRNPGEVPGNGIDDDTNGYVDDVYGIDAFNQDSDPMDDQGHGTHVAGTIGARGNNGVGVVGVAWNTSILACKFINAQGSGTDAGAVECFDYLIALKQRGVNIRVSNNSWGSLREGEPAVVLKNAIDTAGANGILNVFAAGNAGADNDANAFDPASFDSPSIIVVAASDESDGRPAFSNYGATSVDLAAPGSSILSTYDGSYAFSSGTSMAAPHVAGAAALLFSRNPLLAPADVRTLLEQHVDVLPQWTGVVASAGRLNLQRAMASAGGNEPPAVAITSPANGAVFPAPAALTIEATASDEDGSIVQVAFFANGAPIGVDAEGPGPYTVNWAPQVAGAYVLTAVATDDAGTTRESAPVSVSVSPPAGRPNVALAANGGQTVASSALSGYPASAVNDGDRKGVNWGSGGGWADGTPGAWPDWMEVHFNGPQTIEQVDVITVQDAYASPVEPTTAMTFASFGVVDFRVEYWTGSGWQAVPGGVVTGNNRVWRQFHFLPVLTSAIRVVVTNGLASYSRLVEVEAYASLGAVNTPPTATLTGPADGTSYVSPATVLLSATASDPDGTVAGVEFRANGASIGAATVAGNQYTLSWPVSVAGTYALTAVATDNTGASFTSSPVTITVAAPAGRVNVAAAANGATASASSVYSGGYPAQSVINGDRRGLNWGNGGGWADGTSGQWPDSVEVHFNGSRAIEEVDIFTVQDNYASPAEPTTAMTFSAYGVVDFRVEYWTGSTWVPIPGAAVTGNNLVWRQFNFSPVVTSRIRVFITNALSAASRLTEIEAYAAAGSPSNAPPAVAITAPADGASYVTPATVLLTATASDTDGSVSGVEFLANGTSIGAATAAGDQYTLSWPVSVAGTYALTAVATDDGGATSTSSPVTITVTPAAGRINVAAAANGATVSASSVYSGGYPAQSVNNGDRRGLNWGNGGGWADGTSNQWPDWVEVQFNGAQAIEEVDVFTVQDNYANPAEPTAGMTFSAYGVVDFRVEYWTGATWAPIPGAAATGNNLVWRQFTFSPVVTSRIRVFVTNGLSAASRVTEVEAYAVPGSVNAPPAVAIVGPAESAVLEAGSVVPLSATASDSDGTVTRVDFYIDDELAGSGTDAGGTFTFNWTAEGSGDRVITAVATDDGGATTVSAPVTVSVSGGAERINVALAANGGSAVASSSLGAGYPVGSIINGDRRGLNWGNGGGWADKTRNKWPDSVEVHFDGEHTIDEIDVITIQDTYSNPSEPTALMTFSQFGIVNFTVEYWTGSAWQVVPGGAVTGNSLVWRRFGFTPITTSRIRVVITNGLSQHSRLAEVEAWTSVGGATTASVRR